MALWAERPVRRSECAEEEESKTGTAAEFHSENSKGRSRREDRKDD